MAACGGNFTVTVTGDGELLACGEVRQEQRHHHQEDEELESAFENSAPGLTLETRLRLNRLASEHAASYDWTAWPHKTPPAPLLSRSEGALSSALGLLSAELNNASEQIVRLHHAQYDLEDRVTLLLRERHEDQERLKTIGAWLERAMQTKSGRDFTLTLDKHFRKLLSACFGGWCHCSWKKKRERVGLTRCARRVEKKQLLAAFDAWRYEVDATGAREHSEDMVKKGLLQVMHDRARKDAMLSAARLVRKMRYSALARAFNNLVAHTHAQRQIQTKTIKMLRDRIRRTLARTVLSWHAACCASSPPGNPVAPFHVAQFLRHRQHKVKLQVVSAWRLHSVYRCAGKKQARTKLQTIVTIHTHHMSSCKLVHSHAHACVMTSPRVRTHRRHHARVRTHRHTTCSTSMWHEHSWAFQRRAASWYS
jgi:hypothetical protein